MPNVNASRYVNLKARVKAECLRRKYSGSVAAYGGASYDYTVTPAAGKPILKEHRDKLVTPLSMINLTNVSATNNYGDKISDAALTILESSVTLYEKRSITDSSGTDCNSGCTGMCKGCQTTCTGSCSGGCKTTCTGSCSGGCKGDCSGCGGDCGGTCQSCSYCASSCNDDCHRGCSGGCSTSASGCVINN